MFQVLAGLTSRAVVLLSAQLVAAFIQRVDALSYIMGMTLGIALILSQVRAVHMFLAALKLDLSCLLPKLERNSEISLSTNYLACAAIYKKLAVEPTPHSRRKYKDMVAETKLAQSLTGLDDDEAKSKRRNLKAKLGKCKICRFGSPKYW